MTPEELAAKEQADAQEAEAAKKTAKAEELLKGLKLKDAEIEALKGNEGLSNVLIHALEAKRDANREAKERREKLEALELEKATAEKEKLEKKGEYEKLYKESVEKESLKDEKIKTALIKGELARLAGAHGLAKNDYLKLLDQSEIVADVDTLEVTGAEEVFVKFKEDNPELFGKASVPNTDTGQAKLNGSSQGDLEKLETLKARAGQTRMPRDIAAYMNLERELKKKGKI